MNQSEQTILYYLNQGLHQAFALDPNIYCLGEDILDPYGGAFKVTQGLSSQYPDRVLTTPISEAGIVGVATGMALRGLRPVVEIMFGDFLSLIADQLINHLSKFRWMYNDQVRAPVVIRTPMGGRRGYGPTHSQSLEKIYLGIPGLYVLAVNSLSNPTELLRKTILTTEDPVLFIENKLLYPSLFQNPEWMPEFDFLFWQDDRKSSPFQEAAPTITVSIKSAPPPCLSLAAYGYMANLAMQAMLQLAYQYEIFCELILPTQLLPLFDTPFISSVENTKHLLVLEEATSTHGWGSEILARISEATGGEKIQVARLGAKEHPIPASQPLENKTLPGISEIINSCLKLINKNK
jgi:pyruvate/2-oxoglutarate/acetoin dehydrogenase E1 component